MLYYCTYVISLIYLYRVITDIVSVLAFFFTKNVWSFECFLQYCMRLYLYIPVSSLLCMRSSPI